MNDSPINGANSSHEISETKSHIPWSTIILGTGLAVCLGGGIYEHMDLTNARMETAALQREVAAMRQTVNSVDSNFSQSVGALRAEIDTTKKESLTSAEQAKLAARRQAAAVEAKLNSKFTQSQEEQQRVVNEQLNSIRSQTDQATAKLTDITTEVGTVKTDVASTRSDLDRTISDLHRTTGDMGVMSGLIATNSKELAALRELGERDYLEFTLGKNSGIQRVGDIQVALKRTDPKKNRFTLEIVADDKHVEKKDRNVNEPVQFYVTSKARQPYELVVNEIKKDTVIGYLSVPKAKMAARKL